MKGGLTSNKDANKSPDKEKKGSSGPRQTKGNDHKSDKHHVQS